MRDQLFIDNLQPHYRKFESKMNESYAVWQEQSLKEVKAVREAEMEAIGEGIIGALAIVGAVALVVASQGDYNPTPSILGDSMVAHSVPEPEAVAGLFVLMVTGFVAIWVTRRRARVTNSSI